MSPFTIRIVGGVIILMALVAGGSLYVVYTKKDAISHPPTRTVTQNETVSTTTEVATKAATIPDNKPSLSVVATSSPDVAAPAPSSKNVAGPELASIAGYINTNGQSVTVGQFVGKKVVLLDMWSSSCINCWRTVPYLRAWQEKYGSGLQVIGVHTPQFSFEYGKDAVSSVVTDLGITYPVVLDNKHATWNALGNEYWPELYLVDINGKLAYQYAGGGGFAATERAIQKALIDRNAKLGTSDVDVVDMLLTSPSDAIDIDFTKVQSPESYFGSERNDRLGNAILWTEGKQTTTIPNTLKQNAIYLGGTWNFDSEYAESMTLDADIRYSYNAKEVYLVAGSASPTNITITRDGGKPLGDARGKDVDASGRVMVGTSRVYQLINDKNYGVHTIEIHIDGKGFKAYVLTFG